MTMPTAGIDLIRPDWPAPVHVQACTTTRIGGVSRGRWRGLNLGDHVGDEPGAVAGNRARLTERLALPCEPRWLTQVHGNRVRGPADDDACADACFEDRPGQVCVVLTADCLPVLLCDRAGTRIAAAHAGWRGLLAGVLERTAAAIADSPGDILAWLGPAIGPGAFEVGDEVRGAFVAEDPASAPHFVANGSGHWLADLYGLARLRFARLGIGHVSGGEYCTFSDPARFFSYRRDGVTGRMASMIWLQP
ncbi:MAG: peptidoglycan editing factor PgeF [Chromatiaceae bacterium]